MMRIVPRTRPGKLSKTIMKTQEEINAAWKQTYPGKGGMTFEILTPPKRESGLRKPYQYKLTERQIRKLIDDLKALEKKYRATFQHVGPDVKAVLYGMKISFFALAFMPDYCGDGRGVDEAGWNKFAEELRKIMATLDTDFPVYIEPWTAERKFQARFETYILRA